MVGGLLGVLIAPHFVLLVIACVYLLYGLVHGMEMMLAASSTAASRVAIKVCKWIVVGCIVTVGIAHLVEYLLL